MKKKNEDGEDLRLLQVGFCSQAAPFLGPSAHLSQHLCFLPSTLHWPQLSLSFLLSHVLFILSLGRRFLCYGEPHGCAVATAYMFPRAGTRPVGP